MYQLKYMLQDLIGCNLNRKLEVFPIGCADLECFVNDKLDSSTSSLTIQINYSIEQNLNISSPLYNRSFILQGSFPTLILPENNSVMFEL